MFVLTFIVLSFITVESCNGNKLTSNAKQLKCKISLQLNVWVKTEVVEFEDTIFSNFTLPIILLSP